MSANVDDLETQHLREPCQHGRGMIVAYGWQGHRWLEVCKTCGRPAYVTWQNEVVAFMPPNNPPSP